MSIKKIIAIGSAKGGVGKSTITAALSSSLSKHYKVGVLDADIYGPNQHILFQIENKPEFITKGDSKFIKPFKKNNVEISSMGLMLDPDSAAAWRGPMLSGAIKQLSKSTMWGELDYLFIDMPPGTGDAYLTIFKEVPVDGFILISTPSLLSIADLKKTISLVNKFKLPIIGYIENNIFEKKINIKDDIFLKKNINKLGEFNFSDDMMNFSPEIKNECADAISKTIIENV